MATTQRAPTTARNTVANGAARHPLPPESARLLAQAENAVTDLAHSLRDTADRQSKLAKRQARKLYRQSSATIKHNPWRAVGAALLTGIVAGGLLMLTRRTGVSSGYTEEAGSDD